MVCQKTRFEVFKRDGFTCQYCGRKSPEVILEADHITPASKGGTDEMGNLITSCRECNRGKSNIKLILDTPIPDHAAKDKARDNLSKINTEIADKENELRILYLLQKEALINIFKVDIEMTQYKINNLTEENMINYPDYHGESLQEFIIKQYKYIGFLETRVMDEKSSDKVNIELKLDIDMLFVNNTSLSRKDIIKRAMEKEFQILPEAIDLILATNNHERTISTLLKNIDGSVIVIDTKAVKKYAFVN